MRNQIGSASSAWRTNVNYQLAICQPLLNEAVGIGNGIETEMAWIEPRHQLSCFRQAGSLPHDVTMVLTTFPGQEGKQREDP